MSDRLKDLQRQRAMAQEQLDWLDREIARESGGKAPLPAAGAKPESRPSTDPTTLSADDIIARYQGQGRPVHSEVKRGCLLYFFAAFALLLLGLTAFWFLRRL